MWQFAINTGIRRRAPYQTRHTYACWALSAGANPSFIASQLGHEDAQMVSGCTRRGLKNLTVTK